MVRCTRQTSSTGLTRSFIGITAFAVFAVCMIASASLVFCISALYRIEGLNKAKLPWETSAFSASDKRQPEDVSEDYDGRALTVMFSRESGQRPSIEQV